MRFESALSARKEMKRKLRAILRFLFWLIAIPVAAAAIALSVYDVRLPQSLTDKVCERLSGETMYIRCDFISFGFRRGLVINKARAFLKGKTTTAPVFKADEIDASLALYRFPWRMERLLRRVRVKGLTYLRLPDGYYIPDSIEFPGQPDYKETDEPVVLDLPVLRPFKLELIEPDILGVRPAIVEAAAVSSGKNGFKARGISLDWPDRDTPMHVSGEVELDLVAQTVEGRVSGKARQWHIRPLLDALDIPIALEYIDAFTEVHEPVDASYRFSVNLRNNDFFMSLDLAPKAGLYRGVPYSSAKGTIEINTAIRGTNFNSRVVVGPIVADFLPQGHAEGTIVFTGSNGVRRIALEANSSRLSISNALAVADVFTDGSLDALQMETPPLINIKGVLAIDKEDSAANDLRGTFSFERGSFFGVPVRNVQAQFHQMGTSVVYPNATASLKSGGRISATAKMDFPDYDDTKSTFSVKADGAGLALGDICEALKIDSGDRKGTVECHVELDGPLSTNLAHRLNGSGRFNCHDGHLSRTKLFMGFTDFLSENIPGVASVVDMTQSSADLTVSNGVISTKNLFVEGNIFAIKASGSYDLAANNLEAHARAQIFKKDSLLGILTQPITSTLMKMLLEFRIYGPIEEPKWTYSTPVTRLGGSK